jgi:hypothetical protein
MITHEHNNGSVRRTLAWWLVLFVWFMASPAAAQVEAPRSEPARVLFIGNSYTYVNDLPHILQAMAAAAPGSGTLHVASVVEGGATLQRHWNDSTRALIRSGRWDFVVLQEQSQLPLRERASFLEYGKRFAEEVRAGRSHLVLYVTWSRKSRPADQESLNAAYLELAQETGATLVPVGTVWEELRQLDTVSDLYAEDGSHPSRLGSYVAASTFYRVLFGAPSPASYGADIGLDPLTVATVRRAIEAAVTRLPPAKHPEGKLHSGGS